MTALFFFIGFVLCSCLCAVFIKGGVSAIRATPWLLLALLVLGEIFIVGGMIRSVMLLLNPRFVLELDGPTLLGGEFTGRWRTTGGITQFTNVTLMLEGREEARIKYSRTTKTYTAVFARIPLVGPRAAEVKGADLWMSMPQSYPPSFAANGNRIYWCIVAIGEVKGWTDSVEDFEVNFDCGHDREISGFIEWSEAKKIEGSVVVELVYYVRGHQFSHRVRVAAMDEVVLQPGQTFVEYKFRVPPGAPYTLRGVYLNIEWSVEVVGMSQGLLAHWTPLVEHRIIVSPTNEPLSFSRVQDLSELLAKHRNLEAK